MSKSKQADIGTASLAANMWRMDKLNAALMGAKLNSEDNYGSIGKGFEWANTVFPSHWDVGGAIEKFTSVESALWAFGFAMGKVSEAVGVYTITPLDTVADGLELPYFSFAEAVRPGVNSVIDRMAIGCAMEAVTLTLKSGPGREACKLQAEFVGSGKLLEPSGLATDFAEGGDLAAMIAETYLRSASATVTINGVNYVTTKNLRELVIGYKNNIMADEGFYIGSGFQDNANTDSGAIRGRLEVGNRVASMSFQARFVKDSTELTKIKNVTKGAAVCRLAKGVNDYIQFDHNQVAFKVAEIGDANGIITVQVDTTPLHDGTGIFTVTGKSAITGIAQVAA